MIWGITLIILGLLAVPSLILSRKPDAKELFDKVAPFQGWVGLVFAILGLISLVRCILSLNLLGIQPLAWIIWLLAALAEAALGFILGYCLIQKYALSKNPEAQKKGDQLLAKLLPLQGTLGIIAIVIGILQVVSSIIWF